MLMQSQISAGIFIMLVVNVVIFLSASSSLAKVEKKRACMFAVLALIISFMPWVQIDKKSHLDMETQYLFLNDGR